MKMTECVLKTLISTMIFFLNVEFALVSDDLGFDRKKKRKDRSRLIV